MHQFVFARDRQRKLGSFMVIRIVNERLEIAELNWAILTISKHEINKLRKMRYTRGFSRYPINKKGARFLANPKKCSQESAFQTKETSLKLDQVSMRTISRLKKR